MSQIGLRVEGFGAVNEKRRHEKEVREAITRKRRHETDVRIAINRKKGHETALREGRSHEILTRRKRKSPGRKAGTLRPGGNVS